VLIQHYGDLPFMKTTSRLGVINVCITSTVSLMAQSFFISRIIRFAERPLIKYGTPILLAPLVLWQFIGLQLYFSAGLTLDTSQINQLRKYAISTFIAQSTVDIMVAIVMSFLLYSRRSVIKRTNHIIKSNHRLGRYWGMACRY